MYNQRISPGSVNATELQVIEPVLERLAGLEELALIVDDVLLKEKINRETAYLVGRRNKWWFKVIKKYCWPCSADSEWEIELETGVVYLI